MTNKLTNKKHIAFCEEYLNNGLNQRQAYLTVYKSVKSVEGADASASKLLSNPKVSAYLSVIHKKTAKKSEVSREKIVARLNKRSELVEEMQALASKEKLTSEEESQFARLMMVIKTSDANKSDEILNKMLGFNEPDKLDIQQKTWNVGFGNDDINPKID